MTLVRSNDRSIDLINEVSKTFAAIGYDKTVEAITRARENSDPKKSREALEKFILKESCKVFNISQDKVMNGKTKGTRTDCLMVIFVLAKKHVQHSLADSAKVYNKSVTRVSRAITFFNNLKESEKSGASILSKTARINEAINHYKEQTN